jgi:molybdate-binding protein/predicted nucleic acid-binding protein
MTVRYLFDTHLCLYLIRRGVYAVHMLFDHCTPGEIAISSLTLAALRARAQHSRAPERNREALDQFVLPLVVADFDAEAAQRLGALAAQVAVPGDFAPQEAMLAAQALRLGAELVTSRPDLYAGIAALRLVAVREEPALAGLAERPAHGAAEAAGAPLAPGEAPADSPAGSMQTPRRGGEPRRIRIAGSHDFTLDLLASALHAEAPGLALALESVGSLRGLLALQQGAAHIAPAHLLDEATGDFNRGYIQHLLTPLGVRVVLLGFVEREQGLIVRKGNPKAVGGLADLLRPDVAFVNRQLGAGTRVLLDYHLRRAGLAARQIRGYDRQEPTHLAVAAAVADGRADCGLGVLAAARALNLDFVPLFHERFDLVIPVEHYAGALLAPLLALLRRPQTNFVQQVAALGGYATGGMGKVLAEM